VFVIFYAQKFFEFLDTYFFVLRKSFRQVRGHFALSMGTLS
jgi:hypothetical protein